MNIGDNLKQRARHYHQSTDLQGELPDASSATSLSKDKELPPTPLRHGHEDTLPMSIAYPNQHSPPSTVFQLYGSRKRNSGLALHSANQVVQKTDLIISAVLTLLGLITRLYRIGKRDAVSWDEAHFGKFGAYYLNHTFYHDVHPPLAKMLVAFAEAIAGHNGTFNFSSGQKYPSYVNYTLMRAQLALYGIALIPLAYLTCIQLNMSRRMSILAALFVLFDNAICVMSRFILLDQPLLCFTAMTLYGIATFNRYRDQAFSPMWWRWLLFTGFSLGLVFSSKWVGLFSILLVGISTAEDLWHMLGNWRMPIEDYLKHWLYRIVGLIIVPLTIYVLCFKIHFAVLYKSGTGDGKMSSAFQAKLRGNSLNTQPLDVVSGSMISIRSSYPGAGFLHSHEHKYPSGSQHQQVTCYTYQDHNNYFTIQRLNGTENDNDTLQFIQDGDIIRLVHNDTKLTLYSSHYNAPVTARNFEVSAFNASGSADTRDQWKVEIHSENSRRKMDGKVHALTTRFRLRHVKSGCYLSTSGRRLPEWAWRQSEVSCERHNKFSPDVLWNVERHINDRLPPMDASKVVRTNFFMDMIHLNIEMARSNNALVPDRNKYNVLESDAWSWPFLIYPMRLVGWGDNNIKYYEIGNPLLWWGSTIVCILYPFKFLWYVLTYRRQASGWKHGELYQWWDETKLLWGGWALHYFSFFFMGRVTYIHHYLPALYFALLLLAYELEYYGKRIARGAYHGKIFYVCAIVACVVFYYFSPFTYGWDTPAKDMAGRRWLSTWNIDIDLYSV
ncbi:Protein O-mannosyltransferase 2 [Spiromyces aspiralis]|uniref:Protein O-mannosyltransferase 2 n=1 Tax=Spiromyces aspiralis TaxID=68401 RepID=A0ACC1HFS8_9FUNG|nr:Protein O-mannosyltransferase 2 [Spiromyces aspiralis]